ncbi:MAG: AAA family ATPase [Methanoregula sp.]|jgi:replication factor C small subunit
MFWTERYRPGKLEEILGQEHVTRLLGSFAAKKTSPHLMLTGPHGTGKSSAISCFARELYGDAWESNTTVFQTADLFSQGKKLLEEDERYAHLYRKGQSFIVNFKYILRTYASMRPLDADFKLMVFEDAHALTRDAQQGLRRIMEQYSGTCRFIFSTTNQSAIIPAITSRCLPLFFSPLPSDLIVSELSKVQDREQGCPMTCSPDDLDLIAQAARGDMRNAILLLQAARESGSCDTLAEVTESETATIVSSALGLLKRGEHKPGIRQLESLMIDYGLSGREVLEEVRQCVRREYNDPSLALTLADADTRLGHANSEYLQIDAFATRLSGVLP